MGHRTRGGIVKETKQLGLRIEEAVFAKLASIAEEFFDGNKTRALEFAITYTLDDLESHKATRIEQQWIVHGE
jgi:hypothetical protein